MPRIACVSDLHENLVDIPECDILIVAGDVLYGFRGDDADKRLFLLHEFRDWCRSVPADQVVVIAGNHDRAVENHGWPLDPSDCEYLQDSGVRMHGLNIWGMPWQPWFHGWAFNAPKIGGERWLKSKFDLIPPDTDIVVCHGPPYGYGDRVGDPHASDRSGQPRAGSRALTEALRRVQPRLMVCGHIHSGAGEYRLHGTPTKIVNAAVVNNLYVPVREPVVVNL